MRMRPHTGRAHVRRGTDRGLFGGMDTKRILGAGAAALTALVLIWDEAPIAYSAGEQQQPRVAYSVHAAPPGPQASPGRDTVRRRADAVVRGDHTGIGPAARPARPTGGADDATADRAGAGTALPPGNAKNVVH